MIEHSKTLPDVPQHYALQTSFDGGVLEISIDAAPSKTSLLRVATFSKVAKWVPSAILRHPLAGRQAGQAVLVALLLRLSTWIRSGTHHRAAMAEGATTILLVRLEDRYCRDDLRAAYATSLQHLHQQRQLVLRPQTRLVLHQQPSLRLRPGQPLHPT